MTPQESGAELAYQHQVQELGPTDKATFLAWWHHRQAEREAQQQATQRPIGPLMKAVLDPAVKPKSKHRI